MATRNLSRTTKRRSSARRAEYRFILFTVIPAFIFYILFRFYPVGHALYMSLHDWQLLRAEQYFVGFDNYVTILSDPLFQKVIWNTLYFAFVTTFAGTALALALAMVLNPIQFGNSAYRLVYFLPVITSTIAIATIWIWLYQPRFGVLNQLLAMLGLGRVGWLSNPSWAMPSLIIMSVWGGVGYTMVIFLAGLRGIPAEYYEAAAIDGANGWQMTRRITLPLLSPVVTFVLVTSLIGGFNVFQQVYLMTRGGPLDATRVLALHIYEFAFQRLWMGQAAAMAFVLFALVMVLTVVQLRLRRIDWAM